MIHSSSTPSFHISHIPTEITSNILTFLPKPQICNFCLGADRHLAKAVPFAIAQIRREMLDEIQSFAKYKSNLFQLIFTEKSWIIKIKGILSHLCLKNLDQSKDALRQLIIHTLYPHNPLEISDEHFVHFRGVANVAHLIFQKAIRSCDISNLLIKNCPLEAAECSCGILNPIEKDLNLSSIGNFLIQSNHFQDARKISEQFGDFILKEEFLTDLANAYTQRKCFDEAFKIIETISDLQKDTPLATLARALADAGQYEKAEKIANSLIDDILQKATYIHITHDLALKEQLYQQILKDLESITDPETREYSINQFNYFLSQPSETMEIDQYSPC